MSFLKAALWAALLGVLLACVLFALLVAFTSPS